LLIVLFYVWKILKNNLYKVLFTLGLFLLILMSGIFIPSLNRQWKELVDFSKENTIILDKDASLERSWGGKTLRLAIWQCSFDVLKKHWLWGVGTGDVQDNLQQAYEDRKFYFASRYNYYNAHNQYLQYGIGFGIPGILLFTLSILYPLVIFSGKNQNLLYLLFLAIFGITALTESVLEINKGIVWYSFFNSIFAFTSLKHQPDIKF
jgi:O-antigen ligase